MRLLSLARQLKYRTSASAAAAGGASDKSPARTAGPNQFMNPATSGAPIMTSTVVSVRILQPFIFSSFFFSRVLARQLCGLSALLAVTLQNGKLRATTSRDKSPKSVIKHISDRKRISR
jgi:hypothetical protein